MSSRFKKRLEQLHGSRQRRRASRSENGESRVFTADGVEEKSAESGESPPADSLASSLTNKWRQQGAKTRSTPRGDASFLVRAHPERHRHGTLRLADGAATKLDCFQKQLNDSRLHSVDPRRLAFLDLETNGLSKTSFPFCIGIGLWEGNSFAVYHYFTPSDEHEPAALSACAQILGDIDGLCTFNGSSFDVRMLERRFRQHGIEHNLGELAHLDLLHLSRKLWPERDSHKLSRLEEDELGFERTDDIPGAKIPGRWRRYQKVGDPRLLLDIFDHNRLDILSMVVLIAELANSIGGSAGGSTAGSPSSAGEDDKPRTKLTSRLARSYALRDKALRDKALRDKTRHEKDRRKKAPADNKPEPQQEESREARQAVTLDASFSRSTLRSGMPIGTRLRELRAEVERLQRSGAPDESGNVLSILHEMVALAPRNPFALQALVAHYRENGDSALSNHFEKRLGKASPF
jgi:uncharacterized protein YprB with RNaseH-like and TPR domain